MSEYFFGLGKGWLPKSADKIARKAGAYLVNYTDPGCGCGYGCRSNDCPANRRHWFACANLGSPFDRQRADKVLAAIEAAGIKAKVW
jgi:hypothetical protein